MTNKAHASLTGSDLHEPKGVETATAGQVYISDGSGSGIWTDTGATIGTASATTGDIKLTIKTVADSGWVILDDGTIGDLSSGASSLASASTQELFYLIWNNISNSYCPVSGGRGISAAADFAAHKTIKLPLCKGRVLGTYGAGSGLTTRSLGQYLGEELHTLSGAELPATTLSFFGTPMTAGLSQLSSLLLNTNYLVTSGGGPSSGIPVGPGLTTDTFTPAGTISSFGSTVAHNNMQPSTFFNAMMKL